MPHERSGNVTFLTGGSFWVFSLCGVSWVPIYRLLAGFYQYCYTLYRSVSCRSCAVDLKSFGFLVINMDSVLPQTVFCKLKAMILFLEILCVSSVSVF